MLSQLPNCSVMIKIFLKKKTSFAFAHFVSQLLLSQQPKSSAKVIWGRSKNFTLRTPKDPESDEKMGGCENLKQTQKRAFGQISITLGPDNNTILLGVKRVYWTETRGLTPLGIEAIESSFFVFQENMSLQKCKIVQTQGFGQMNYILPNVAFHLNYWFPAVCDAINTSL